ncbi:unnamed protein product [Cyprideis torosa]|uniref:Uncharacterized protein n=1 Tax=Cyprideis torosa TaxID=163714 RepID=A0A7R8WPH6_9CRUS|nr:unnamed protein product [Cyprideis torosa]CAG0907277.1 unnamed protein product [Cyprideis torosa]
MGDCGTQLQTTALTREQEEKRLEVRCPEVGCGEIVRLGDLKGHRTQCVLKTEVCSGWCEQVLLNKEKEGHECNQFMKNQVDQLSAELLDRDERMSQLDRENQGLLEVLKETTEKSQQLLHEVETLQTELQTLREQKNGLEVVLGSTEAEVDDRDAEIGTLSDQLVRLKQRLKESNGKLASAMEIQDIFQHSNKTERMILPEHADGLEIKVIIRNVVSGKVMDILQDGTDEIEIVFNDVTSMDAREVRQSKPLIRKGEILRFAITRSEGTLLAEIIGKDGTHVEVKKMAFINSDEGKELVVMPQQEEAEGAKEGTVKWEEITNDWIKDGSLTLKAWLK